MSNRKGFTLVEVIVILVVISILAAIAVPVALKIFEKTATDATTDEMQNLQKAMIGDQSKIEGGVRADFGYLGDMGCLPTPTTTGLTSLLTQGSFPGWIFNAATQIGSGWRGPYITGAATGAATDEFTKDQWGNDYVYTITGACPLTATFQSKGPDGTAGGGDDIDYSITASDTTSTVSGYILDPNTNPVANSTVTINYPGGSAGPGSPTTATTTANSAGRFSVSNIPFGKRSLNVNPKLIVTSARAFPTGTQDANCGTTGNNGCSIVDFMLINYSTATVSVTSITPNYSSGSFFYRVEWGGTIMACGGTLTCPAPNAQSVASLETATFASKTVGPGAALPAFVFFVTSIQTEVNPAKIGVTGGGTSVRVRLLNFRDSATGANNGNQVPVAGVPFSITFSDGSTVQFTPP